MSTDTNDAFDNFFNKLDGQRDLDKHLNRNSRILLVDGLNTFMRSFHVSPQANEDGEHVGGLTGFLNSIGYAIKIHRPTRVIVAFDGPGGSKRRRKIYPEYKDGRKPKSSTSNRFYQFHEDADQIEKDRKRQVVRSALYLKTLPVTLVMVDNIEADDIIAFICKSIYTEENQQKIIMSSDKDFLQLVDETTKVWSPTKKKTYDVERVLEEYEIPPHQFMTYRTIQGDSSDNIPGIKYVGKKRIKDKLGELIDREERTTPDDIVEYAEARLDESATYGRIADAGDILWRNWKLMQLHDVDIGLQKEMDIRDIVVNDKAELRYDWFTKLYHEDKLWDAIPNPKRWVDTRFERLNRFSRLDDLSDE